MVDPVLSKSSDMTGEKGWFPQKKINEVLLEVQIVEAGLARLRHLSTYSGSYFPCARARAVISLDW